MPTKPKLQSKEDYKKFIEAYNDLIKYPTILDVSMIFKMSERTARIWRNKLAKQGYDLIDRSKDGKYRPKSAKQQTIISFREKQLKDKIQKLDIRVIEQKKEIIELKKAPLLNFEERLDVKKFRDTINILQKDLREAERQALTSDHMKGMIWGMGKHEFGGYPNWLQPQKGLSSTNGIPCLFLSDIHFDEYVDPAQINFVNEYSRQIAIKRIQHTFNTVIDILFNRTVNPKYQGFILAFGGDLFSGNIHEELAETNEDAIMRSLLVLVDLLIDGIDKLLEHFDDIFIPCVVGNHGRMHKKVRAKNKVFDNYEWLAYQFLARHYKDDKRVQFLIPDGPDAHFTIYNKGFLLTHGDQFKGGNAIAGIFSPLMLGFHRKQKKQASINKSFDVMMVAHFHQYIHTNQLVMNGSIKGYDEFANIMNFAFEPPQQSLFLNHPHHGMVFRTPILCDSYKKQEKFTDEKIVILK